MSTQNRAKEKVVAEEGGEKMRGKENNTKVCWRRGEEKEESRTEGRREERLSSAHADTRKRTHMQVCVRPADKARPFKSCALCISEGVCARSSVLFHCL